MVVVMKVKVEHEEHIKYCAIHHHKLNKSTLTIDNEVDNVAQHEQEDIVQHVHDVDDAEDVIVAEMKAASMSFNATTTPIKSAL